MSFELHPQLTKDTSLLGEFPLSLALLHRDDSVPWVILVPKKADLTELHHLPMQEQQQFLLESEVVNRALEALFTPDKLNFGALVIWCRSFTFIILRALRMISLGLDHCGEAPRVSIAAMQTNKPWFNVFSRS